MTQYIKSIILSLVLLTGQQAFCQIPGSGGAKKLVLKNTLSDDAIPIRLQSLIRAERSFSKASVERNLRDAFVENLADDAILLEQCKEVLGLETWAARPADWMLLANLIKHI